MTIAAVTPTPTVSPAPSATPEPETARVTAMSLHVRVRPGERERVIGYLYNADAVTLTGKCRTGWAQIEWQDATAWVKAKYLSENKCQ